MVDNTTAPKENKDLARKEEPTNAPTPDKLDRSARDPASSPDNVKPYPLTEEEATPSAGVHERDHSILETDSTEQPASSKPTAVAKDYNKLISEVDKKNSD
jgi:hypothetical protein